MSIVLDSLRPNDACRNPPSPADSCRVDASFHTRIENPQTHVLEVSPMEPQDFLRFRRETRDGQVRFVLEQASLGSVFRGLTLAHGFVPENNPDLQATFHFSVSLTPVLLGLFNEARRGNPNLSGQVLPLFQNFIDFLMAGEIASPDRLQDNRTRELWVQTLQAPQEYRQILRRLIFPFLEINRNRLSPPIISRFERFRDLLSPPSTPRSQVVHSPPPRVNPHPRLHPPSRRTENAFPAVEGVLCALGAAGAVADSIRMGVSGGSDSLDHIFLGISGFVLGLGCTPLIGRAIAGAPRNPWLRDGILGGVGGLSLGGVGALFPFAFRPQTPLSPVDGRGPTGGFGP